MQSLPRKSLGIISELYPLLMILFPIVYSAGDMSGLKQFLWSAIASTSALRTTVPNSQTDGPGSKTH